MNKAMIALVVLAVGVVGYMLMSPAQPQEEMAADTVAPAAQQPIAAPAAKEPMMADKTIVEVAQEAGTFSTLIAAAQAAGLVETLTGEGPLTVFAPTDAAFAKLPAGTVEGLLQDTKKLTEILTYHVVAGKVMSDEVVLLDSAKTVQGDSVMIEVVDGKVKINDATVTTADVEASNGVIHIIDTVLLSK